MKWTLLAFLAAGCITSSVCVPAPHNRIIGGDVAIRGDLPWQTLVVSIWNGQIVSYCGGALISKDYVLTAAQCVTDVTRLEVYLGAHNISSPNEPNRVILKTDVYTIHENYSSTHFDNDIAIIQLPRSISKTPYIDYIRVPHGDEAEAGFIDWYGTVAGWGFTRDGQSTVHDVLRYSFNVVVEPTVCSAHYGAEWMSPDKICVATEGGRGPCYGDAGGPIIKQNEDGSFTLMGLFSFLDTDSCQRGIPVGFTRVGAYVDWMRKVAGFVPV